VLVSCCRLSTGRTRSAPVGQAQHRSDTLGERLAALLVEDRFSGWQATVEPGSPMADEMRRDGAGDASVP
jgi:hypothetical protein